MWHITVRDVHTSELMEYRSKILISAVGTLSVPRKCTIPGASSFHGKIFHTAQWDHTFNWKDKELVVVGKAPNSSYDAWYPDGNNQNCRKRMLCDRNNPEVSSGPGAAKTVTQFCQQAHWLADRPNPEYSAWFKWIMERVPLAMRIYRAKLYWN